MFHFMAYNSMPRLLPLDRTSSREARESMTLHDTRWTLKLEHVRNDWIARPRHVGRRT